MSFWSDFFQRELIIRVASMDLMDLVLVVFFAIPTSFQNYPKGYLLRKRVAIIILSLSKRLLSTLPSRTYMSPHVLAPCQELFPNPISLISPSPSFSAHHFQIDRSYIVKKCWFPSWFSQLHDVPWCPSFQGLEMFQGCSFQLLMWCRSLQPGMFQQLLSRKTSAGLHL